MRHAEVRLDHWLLPGKVVDLPTVIESLKTIDNKSFYKTADICQLLLCKEEEDQVVEEESPQKKKKGLCMWLFCLFTILGLVQILTRLIRSICGRME